MCRVLQVSASGYYAWRVRPDSARLIANRHLLGVIRRLEAEHRGRYGSPRMHATLRAEGQTISRGRVARSMRRHGIRGLAGRRFRPCTTDGRHDLPIAPNLLKQAFTATAPNTVWLAYITYVLTGEGWLYLAAGRCHVNDCYLSRALECHRLWQANSMRSNYGAKTASKTVILA